MVFHERGAGAPPIEAPLLDELVAATGGFALALGPPAGEPALVVCRGFAEREEGAAERAGALIGEETLFDLASLTKPLATGALALRLAEAGRIDLDEPLHALLPELAGYAGRTPSLSALLTHTSGLPAWHPLYRDVAGPARVRREHVLEAIAALAPRAPAGVRAIYSCLGTIAAGIALERVAGASFDELFADELRAPAGVPADELRFGPLPAALLSRVAPTERGRGHEAGLAEKWRRGVGCGRELVPGPQRSLRGEVHDGNARLLGGVAGNAGLFGSVGAVFRAASALVTPGALLAAESIARFARPVSVEGARRSFGFEHGSEPAAPAGALGPASFGHTGFTGTSLWIAPEIPLVVVLLSNRVHPRYRSESLQPLRRRVHDLAREYAASWRGAGEAP